MSKIKKYNKHNPYYSKSGDSKGVFSYSQDLLASNTEKTKEDNELAKQHIDYYVNTTNQRYDDDRYDENMNLLYGRWPKMESYFSKSPFSADAKHHGILNQVCESILGDDRRWSTNWTVRDLSEQSITERERVEQEITTEYFYNTLIKPREDIARSKVMEELGIDDPSRLSEQERVEVQKQLEQAIREGVPEELYEKLEEVKTPEDIIFSKFLGHIYEQQKVEDKFTQGAEFNVALGEECYQVGEWRGHPFVKVLYPKYVNWGSSERIDNIQEATWATYTEYMTPQDIVANFGMELTRGDLKDVEMLFTNTTQNDKEKIDHFGLELTEVVADNPEIEADLQNPLTKEGQQKLQQLYNLVGTGRASNGGQIKVTYVTWKWTRWMYLVTRVVRGEKKTFWRSDYYRKNPSLGDVKVQKKLVPQVWQGYCVGNSHQLKLCVGPVPFQYKNIDDPFDVKLPIIGGFTNTSMGTVRNSSFVDRGKAGNLEYNMYKAMLEETNRKNLGKILMYNNASLPEGTDTYDLFASLKQFGIGQKQSNYKGSNLNRNQDFEQFDLSNIREEGDIIQRLEYIKKEIYEAMMYNKSKLGDIGQYSKATNARLNVQASDNQLSRYRVKRQQIKREVLDQLLHLTLNLYKGNDDMKSMILDDYSRAYLEKNYGHFHSSFYGLFVVDDFKEKSKLEEVRYQLFSLTQGGATLEEVIEVSDADTMGGLRSFARKFDKRKAKAAENESKIQQQLSQMELDRDKEMMKLKHELEMIKQSENNRVKIIAAEISSQMLANANDINQNKENDYIERQRETDVVKKDQQQKEHDIKMQELELKKQKLRQDYELKLKELEARKR